MPLTEICPWASSALTELLLCSFKRPNRKGSNVFSSFTVTLRPRGALDLSVPLYSERLAIFLIIYSLQRYRLLVNAARRCGQIK